MFWRHRETQVTAREPHPDPRTEAELQRIIRLRAAIARQEGLCGEYRAEMASARVEQEKLGRSYRTPTGRAIGQVAYTRAMELQGQRITAAREGQREAEDLITAMQAEITGLTGKLDDFDLTYL